MSFLYFAQLTWTGFVSWFCMWRMCFCTKPRVCWDAENTVSKAKHGGGSIVWWRCFSSAGAIKLDVYQLYTGKISFPVTTSAQCRRCGQQQTPLTSFGVAMAAMTSVSWWTKDKELIYIRWTLNSAFKTVETWNFLQKFRVCSIA